MAKRTRTITELRRTVDRLDRWLVRLEKGGEEKIDKNRGRRPVLSNTLELFKRQLEEWEDELAKARYGDDGF